ncbi:MAG: SRPBCC family protein, partial [Candidatus Eremiobacteraeota bacterium]|nr:SRPBCC family protein [Candidatus Eremiobacteraeota bacterium]
MTAHATWTWQFPVERERLWRYLADTDWVNEHAGLPKIAARYEPLETGGTRRIAWFRKGPVLFEWEERPTVWERPSYFAVERLYRHGPLSRFATSTALEALDDGSTRVVVECALDAASPLTQPLLPLIMAQGKRGANRAFRLAAALAAQPDGVPVSAELGPLTPLLRERVEPAVAGAIATFVASAENRDLQRMRPYELADRWNLPRRDVLRAFLTATRLGLFNLSWSVICPGCRGPQPGMESLAQLHRGYHCEACNLQFDAAFDRSVEVTFDARPLGRATEQGLFCIASPVRSSHVYAQAVVAAEGGTHVFEADLERGSYDINVVGASVAPFSAVEEDAPSELEAGVYPLTGIESGHEIRAGRVRIHVTNELDREVVVRIEDGRWPDTYVTAAQVTALQDFRDLFSSQVLAPGLEMGIETMAILFTDLIGSTAMYSRTGDAPAFRIVTDHFDVV